MVLVKQNKTEGKIENGREKGFQRFEERSDRCW